jgi:SAM-dependent methyltransferase
MLQSNLTIETSDSPAYEGYVDWKNWTRPFTFSEEDAEYFSGEMRGIAISGADVLEIGFGNGNFLAWAGSKGARAFGTEIIPEMLAAAEKAGVSLLPAEIETICAAHQACFDSIVSFDVFEHFPQELVAKRIRSCVRMLKPGGKLLLRFPNAQSPFGLVPQYGDPTHKSALSKGVIERLTRGLDCDVIRYAAQFRIRGRFPKRIVRDLRYIARDMIGKTLNAVYCQSIPMDPVVVLVLEKRL